MMFYESLTWVNVDLCYLLMRIICLVGNRATHYGGFVRFVTNDLYRLAKSYIAVISKIEKTKDPEDVQLLEEERVLLHGKLMDLLARQGIEFKDRDHVTRIAYRIVNGEL